MKIVRALHQFSNSANPIINLSDVTLEWAGIATLSGRSGSGKTTLFRLLSAWYDGPPRDCIIEPLIDRLRQVRFVGAHESLLPWKTVAENLACRGISRDAALVLCEELQLAPEILDSQVYELSYGMYKRLELAIAVHDGPELLLLDEFFTSIDDVAKRSIRDYIQRRRASKTWVIAHEAELRKWLTTNHYSLVIDEKLGCVTDIAQSA